MKKLSDCRVLLVDDAKTNLDILVEGLKSDHKLSLALDGETALQVAARTPPDLVLLDIAMPGLDGYEVCRRLRQMPETAEVPIMFLSSLEEVQNKTRGFEAGANDYLTKPFEMLEVKARVRSLLKAKAYSDAVKEQIASELRVAREIQMGMLPHDLTEAEREYGLSFGAVLEPAREVGGDLYGVCAAGAERLVVFFGDVSGKGIPASMFMVRAISLARLLARQIAEPERILARLNDELSADNPSGMFVTFLCAVFEPKTGRIAIANAGHCRPVLLSAHEPARWAVKKLGTALGFEPGLEFERTELTLHVGDALILYSDGVSEAFNPQEECYGDARLLAEVGGHAGQPAPDITASLLENVRAFAGSAPQSDDIAILTLRVQLEKIEPAPPPSKAPASAHASKDSAKEWAGRTLELQATPEEVMRGVETLHQFAQAQGLPEKTVFGLALALEECGSNIVNHAYQHDVRQVFQVVLNCSSDEFVIELRDCGPEFDPTAVVERPPQARDDDPPGGWGIQLVRRSIDEIHYDRRDGKNILRLTKRLQAPNGEKNFSSPNNGEPQRNSIMQLEIQIQKSIAGQDTGAVTVKLTGSLDTATAPELERQLAPVLAPQSGTTDVVFDLAQLKFISSAGLRIFSATRKTLKERGGQASFIHMQPQIKEVFEIMKSLPGVAVFQSVEELDRYLAARQLSHANP